MRARALAPLFAVVSLGCGAPEPAEQVVQEDPVEIPTNPGVTMELQGKSDDGHVVVSGIASDGLRTDARALKFTLESDIDGVLMAINPLPDSSWEWAGALSNATHVLQAIVEDEDGNVVVQDLTVDATFEVPDPPDEENKKPDCLVSEPANATFFPSGSTVHFAGSATDDDGDEVRLMWTSNLQGGLFIGEEYSYKMQDGVHVIHVDGDDLHGGLCDREIVILVGFDE